MTGDDPVTMTVRVVPVIDEAGAEEFRRRLAAALAGVPHRITPSASAAETGVIRVPPEMTAGMSCVLQAGADWDEILPGLECKLAGIISCPGPGVPEPVADTVIRAVLEFRLTAAGAGG